MTRSVVAYGGLLGRSLVVAEGEEGPLRRHHPSRRDVATLGSSQASAVRVALYELVLVDTKAYSQVVANECEAIVAASVLGERQVAILVATPSH